MSNIVRDVSRYSDVPNVFSMPLGQALAVYQFYPQYGMRYTTNAIMMSHNRFEQYVVEDLQTAFRLAQQHVPDSKTLLKAKDEMRASDYRILSMVDTKAWKEWLGDRTVDLEKFVPEKQLDNGVESPQAEESI